MNGYPKVFNIESDPREEQNIGEMYNWVIAPLFESRGSLQRHCLTGFQIRPRRI